MASSRPRIEQLLEISSRVQIVLRLPEANGASINIWLPLSYILLNVLSSVRLNIPPIDWNQPSALDILTRHSILTRLQGWQLRSIAASSTAVLDGNFCCEDVVKVALEARAILSSCSFYYLPPLINCNSPL